MQEFSKGRTEIVEKFQCGYNHKEKLFNRYREVFFWKLFADDFLL